ncbi:Bcr/CflA family multidrug efflux MFS transporter [Photobacterium jeanii]|uniref:Bcr/CflA family efflux transporter n=1 Tax=Photobacterium jeanii TaxID=858640 RepID=A0A178KKG0_9GAMM|nr:Bcr/CflA family multidrug efflux MFS transporter [Photobacterium jeanii]OAN17731.1 Bcr/CflA family multidrug efflux MFS transporter [Photobacterium jeanii]PST92607.1 Bcr/CflA family drug resistance efflux transporter [Photobacterium jeanii]
MPKNENQKLSFMLILILGAISALTPLAIDMYLPAMPTIARDLAVSPSLVQSTLTAYTAGFAIGQLLHGPLADSYGRKPVLIIGVVLFGIAAIFSAVSQDIIQLTWVRAAQGFAGASAAVIIQALVRDMFEREEFARTMSFITLVMTVAPLAAPMIGGYVAVWFGWRAIFWVLAAFSVVVLLAVSFKISETLPKEKRLPFNLASTLRNYVRLMTNKSAVGLIFCSGFSFAGMFTFLTVGSFVYIDLYHVSTQNFGYLFGLNVVCLILMTSINGRMVKQKGSHWMLRFGLSVQFIAGFGLILGQLLGLGLWGVVVPVMLFVGTISIIGSNTMACLLAKYPHMAGTASSLAGTIRFGTGTVIGGAVAMMPDATTWPMAMTMAVCALLSAGFYWFLSRDA